MGGLTDEPMDRHSEIVTYRAMCMRLKNQTFSVNLFSFIFSSTFSGSWIAMIVVAIFILIALVCAIVYGRHRRRGDARLQDVEGIEMQNEFGERAEENPYEIIL